MDRPTGIATAGANPPTGLAGTTAIAAKVGILGSGAKTPVGELSPVANVEAPATDPSVVRSTATTAETLPVQVETIYVDEVVPAPPASAQASAPPATAASGEPGTVPSTPATSPSGTAPSGDDGQGEDDGDDDGAPVATAPGDDDGHDDAEEVEHEDEDEDEHEDEDEDEEYEGGEDDD